MRLTALIGVLHLKRTHLLKPGILIPLETLRAGVEAVMSGFVRFVDKDAGSFPVPGVEYEQTRSPKNLTERITKEADTAPTPLATMLYGMTRLLNESELHSVGVLEGEGLSKFMAAMHLANNAAKYMHSTKVSAEIDSGEDYERELAQMLALQDSNE